MKSLPTFCRLYFLNNISKYIIYFISCFLFLVLTSCKKVESNMIINNTNKIFKVEICRLYYLDTSIILKNVKVIYGEYPQYKKNHSLVKITSGNIDSCFEFILNPKEEVILEYFSTSNFGNKSSYAIGSIKLETKNFYLKAEKEEAMKLFNNRINEKSITYNIFNIR